MAVKALSKKGVSNYKQFLCETESLIKLNHPNIVKLFEYYQSKSHVFLVQEMLYGENIYERL